MCMLKMHDKLLVTHEAVRSDLACNSFELLNHRSLGSIEIAFSSTIVLVLGSSNMGHKVKQSLALAGVQTA